MCFFLPGDDFWRQTGYRIEFLPLYTGSLAQDPRLPTRNSLPAKDTEPIAVTTFNWPAGHPHLGRFGSGEYLTTWFVGQIAEDAVSFPFSYPLLPAYEGPRSSDYYYMGEGGGVLFSSQDRCNTDCNFTLFIAHNRCLIQRPVCLKRPRSSLGFARLKRR